jgi:hypothetical protein
MLLAILPLMLMAILPLMLMVILLRISGHTSSRAPVYNFSYASNHPSFHALVPSHAPDLSSFQALSHPSSQPPGHSASHVPGRPHSHGLGRPPWNASVNPTFQLSNHDVAHGCETLRLSPNFVC